MYDSRPDTYKHIGRVRELLGDVITNLIYRGDNHDLSKLESPEVEAFDEFTPALGTAKYGSEEYRANLRKMKPAIQHHYSVNRHHPEHFSNGVMDMSLIDMIEMLCDWKASSERHPDSDFEASLVHNQERFGYDDGVAALLRNTARDLGFIL